MLKKILIAGCSHVVGHGFEDSLDGSVPSVHAWPAKISRDFDCEIINTGQSGQSPTYCVDQLQKYQNKETLSAIIVQFPNRMRSLHSKRLGVINEDFPYHHSPTDSKSWDTTISNYYKFCHNWKTNDINLLSYAGYFEYISKKFNIPLWINCVDMHDLNFLKGHGFLLSNRKSWSQYCQVNDFDQLPDGHYGHDAHERWYNEYIKPWLQEKVFAPVV